MLVSIVTLEVTLAVAPPVTLDAALPLRESVLQDDEVEEVEDPPIPLCQGDTRAWNAQVARHAVGEFIAVTAKIGRLAGPS